MALTRLTKITGPGVSTDTNWVGNNANFTGITTTSTSFNIGVTTIHSTLAEVHNIKSTGIITATGAHFSGNVSIAGTLTYEDVTNIDSVGIITAPAVDVDDFLDVGSNIKLGNAGVITATSFVGDGSGLIGVASTDNIITGTAATFNTYPVDINAGMDVAGVSTFNDNVRLLDGDRLQFGNSQDISIFHNGSHTLINKSGSGTGDLIFNVDQVTFKDTTGTDERLATNSKGIKVGTGVTIETNGQATFAGVTTFTGHSQLLDVFKVGASGAFPGATEGSKITKVIKGSDVRPASLTFDHGGSATLEIGSVTAAAIIGTNSHGANNKPIRFMTGMSIGTLTGGSIQMEIKNNAVNIFNDLDVDGHTNLDNVSIAGVTTIGNRAFITHDLTITGTAPRLIFSDTDHNSDFRINVDGGVFQIEDTTNSNADRLTINSLGNVSIANDLDVDGHTNLDNVSIAGVTTMTGNLNLDYRLNHNGDLDTYMEFPAANRIRFATANHNRLQIREDGRIVTHGYDGDRFIFNHDMGHGARNIQIYAVSDASTWHSFIGTNLTHDGTNYIKPSDNGNENWGNTSGIVFEGANSVNGTAMRFIVDQPGNNGLNYSLGAGDSGKTAAIDNKTVAQFSGGGHFYPGADSTYDLGLNGTRWRNFYADTLYGDGSNLTGISAGTSLTGSTNNNVCTVTGANAIIGENELNWDGSSLVIGGTHSLNPYNQVSTGLTFGGGNDPANYSISTSLENYGGNFSKLDLRWHTGIRIGAQSGYGGVRFFNDEDFDSLKFSIMGGGDHIEAHTTFQPGANNTYNLGTSSRRWANVYTTDLQLSNEGKTNDVDGTWGDWTLQEGENDVFMINNRTGKKFAITMREVS